jgi:hypothetical protein
MFGTRKFSLRPISMTAGSAALIAARVATMRSTASSRSYILLPGQSSIEIQATPTSNAESEKPDSAIVATKSANKAGRPVERKAGTERNAN